MARFNEILAGRYNRFLQKIFQLKGGPPSSQLASEVMPVFPFFAGIENRPLESWQRYWAMFTVAGVAAVNSALRLRNPANSNVIAIFELLSYMNEAALDSPFLESNIVNPFNTDLATVGTYPALSRMDARMAVTNPTLIFSSGTTVNLQARARRFAPANVSIDFILTDIQELTLLPGDALQVRSNNANQQIDVTVIWRERALEESELKS